MAPSQECNSVSSISNSTSSVLWELLVCVGTGDRPRFAAVKCREGCRAASWCLSPPRRGCVWGFVVLVCVGLVCGQAVEFIGRQHLHLVSKFNIGQHRHMFVQQGCCAVAACVTMYLCSVCPFFIWVYNMLLQQQHLFRCWL
jgi:hypothetical protein